MHCCVASPRSRLKINDKTRVKYNNGRLEKEFVLCADCILVTSENERKMSDESKF
jgi:hypothetical protein